MIYLFLMLLTLGTVLSWVIVNIDNGMNNVAIKAFLISLLMYISLCIFFSFEGVKGLPSLEALPDKFSLQAFAVEEPNPTNKNGAIYLWIIPERATSKCPPGLICVKTNSSRAPKAYQIPYTKEMHARMSAIEEKLKNGDMVIVQKENDKNNRVDNWNSPKTEKLRFYDLEEYSEELRKR